MMDKIFYLLHKNKISVYCCKRIIIKKNQKLGKEMNCSPSFLNFKYNIFLWVI